MAYDVATTGLLEEALSEGFQFHRELDNFLLRAGLTPKQLQEARKRASDRAAASTRGFAQAPKRFVAQEVLTLLAETGDGGHRVLAAMVTGFCSGKFPNASPNGQDAIEAISQKRAAERSERELDRKAKQEEEEALRTAARKARDAELLAKQRARDGLRDRFLGIMAEPNAQRRGYLLETFLNELFEFEGLEPRGSFRIVGEQIDGSFLWRQRSNLVECKWTKDPVAGAEFGLFMYKIEGKSADTRGLFISINGYSGDAVKGLNSKGALKFICIDGSHIMSALTGGDALPIVLAKAWRHADETGEAYLHISKL